MRHQPSLLEDAYRYMKELEDTLGTTDSRWRGPAGCDAPLRAAAAEPLADDREVISHSLRLALIACQLRRAWHSGAIDADAAMGGLDRAISDICSSRAMRWHKAPGDRFATLPRENPTR